MVKTGGTRNLGGGGGEGGNERGEMYFNTLFSVLLINLQETLIEVSTARPHHVPEISAEDLGSKQRCLS